MSSADKFSYPPRLMSADAACAYIGFGRTKFRELVHLGVMPKPIDVDGHGNPRWDRLDLDAAVDDLKDRRRNPIKRSRDNLQRRLSQQETGQSYDED